MDLTWYQFLAVPVWQSSNKVREEQHREPVKYAIQCKEHADGEESRETKRQAPHCAAFPFTVQSQSGEVEEMCK